MIERIIAIDGPAGSGKSSVARDVSRKIGYHYLDSGAYYRSVTLYFLTMYHQKKVDVEFANWVKEINLKSILQEITVECKFSDHSENSIFLNGKDVSQEIRSPEVTKEIQHLAPIKEVRDFVNFQIRNLAKKELLILDGRDIGSAVFPESKFKFFLTATVETRAERRYKELKEKGFHPDFEKLKSEIFQRDKTDSEREIGPLCQAKDAFLIDTSGLSKDVVIKTIISELEDRGLPII